MSILGKSPQLSEQIFSNDEWMELQKHTRINIHSKYETGQWI